MGGEYAGAWLRWRGQILSQRFNPLLPLSESYLAHRLEHACTGDLSDRRRSEYRWVIDLDGAGVGTVAAMNPSWGMGYAEIGYMLDEEYQGRGLGTRAVALLVDKLFGETDLHRLYAMISPENTASLRLVGRLGFTCEGRMREHYLIQGRRADEMIYGILRREWEQKRSAVGG
jgi:ribosomal-protein-alanine N-acetyltransferase